MAVISPRRRKLLRLLDSEGGIGPNYRREDVISLMGPTRTASAVVVAEDTTNVSEDFKDGADWVCEATNAERGIRDALASLPAGGGEILFIGEFVIAQVGTFAAGAGLNFPYAVLVDQTLGAISLKGIRGLTTFKLADSQAVGTIPVLVTGTSAAKRTAKTFVEGIKFDGNVDNQPTWTDWGLLEVAYADDVEARRNDFCNAPFMACQWFRNSRRFWFEQNNIVMPSGALCSALRLESKDAWARGNYMVGDAADAMTLIDLAPNSDIDVYPERIEIAHNILGEAGCHIAFTGASRCQALHNQCYDQKNIYLRSIWLQGSRGGGVDYHCYENLVEGNLIYVARKGVFLNGGTAGASNQYCKRNKVRDNRIIEATGATLVNGIEEAVGNVDENTLEGNTIQGATTPITILGSKTTRKGNKIDGLPEENGGTAANISDGGTIAHGLCAAPSHVSLIGSVDEEHIKVTTLDATNITVSIKADGGGAGTQQSIYWRAWV